MSSEDEALDQIIGVLKQIEETFKRRIVKAEIDIQMLKAM